MTTTSRDQLRAIRTFPSLVKYLRDELDWPIASEDFKDLAFDYTTDELGIDPKNAAKIQEIKRLRPLSVNQPWGIFFIKFEPKRLPVVALRRILGEFALKKRASANSAERTAWASDDLLFISNYGEGDDRQISFAHFSSPETARDLPTLKVLGWDNRDTALHLDDVADRLTGYLSWPDDETNAETWRTRWRSAFPLRHREVINTSRELSISLAELAGDIRDLINSAIAIENNRGPLKQLMKAFKEALVHDLDAGGFADMYAQTIAYGLLSARIADPQKKTVDDFTAHMRTNPFLRDLMETFLNVGGQQGKSRGPGIDFDELGVSDVIDLLDDANMEAIVRDFGDKNRDEDPVIHFFEGFLQAYDKQIKKERGVFYTPQPIVSYIVRSAHELLQTEFDLADGLADTTTWGEMLEKHPSLKLPFADDSGDKRTISPDEPFVQILDPATGTGTFLVEIIDVVNRTVVGNWERQGLTERQQLAAWNDYVPKNLLPRLHAYELMMAPYAIAHMRIGIKLAETGYLFDSEDRARIYLTNALEPWVKQLRLPDVDALAHEAVAVNEIKRQSRFTVVVGNPPYSNFGQLNTNDYILDLLEDYKRDLNERKLNLNDDFIKFIRLSEHLLNTSQVGVLGMITNSTYLDGVNHRKMRESLIRSFPIAFFLNLHGNSQRRETPPAGLDNDNVFGIKQGVTINMSLRPLGINRTELSYYDAWGTQEEKFKLLASDSFVRDARVTLDPTPDRYFLTDKDFTGAEEYDKWVSIKSIFPVNSVGIETSRDQFAVAFDKKKMHMRIDALVSSVTDETIQKKYDLKDKPHWHLANARQDLKNIIDPHNLAKNVLYRPFDTRYVCYSASLIHRPRHEVLDNLLSDNLALICVRNSREESTANFFCTDQITDKAVISSRDNANIFPLFVKGPSGPQYSFGRTDPTYHPNISREYIDLLQKALGPPSPNNILPLNLTPSDILHFIYAVFHSPIYRSRYAEYLKIDFPRLPLTDNLELFQALALAGAKLVSLHLMKSSSGNENRPDFTGPRRKVTKVGWTSDNGGTVWIDGQGTKSNMKPGSSGFGPIPEEIWKFNVGGYQVCEKWLTDRGPKNGQSGRSLNNEDIIHYQAIVVALSETVRIMEEIDEVVAEYGGWPDAFQTVSADAEMATT